MALTGLFLISFLVVHCAINAMIFYNDGGATFTHWGHFMGTNPIIRTLEIGLVAGFIIHIFQGFAVWRQNRSARPVKYSKVKHPEKSKWYSRSMGLLGTLVLLFLIVHIAQFWVPSRFGELPEVRVQNGDMVHDLFSKMKAVFSYSWVVILYVLGCISLGYHLAHGFQSAFRTLGVHNRKYVHMLVVLGNWFAVLITIAFISMPVSMYFGIVK